MSANVLLAGTQLLATYHVAVASGDPVAGHGPEEGVHGTRLGAEKVPGRVVGGGRLGDLIVGTRLDRVDEIGESDGVLDEEDGDVVADNIWES